MSHPGVSFVSEQINAVRLPNKLPCKDCGRDKDPSCFAKRHHRDYRYSKLRNPGYVQTARNTSAKCRLCTGEQMNELQCQGACGLWKPLDKFSRNQRTRGDKDCVLWRTSQEPNGETQVPPNGDVAPDEDDTIQGDNFCGSYDPELGDGDSDDGFASITPWSQMESLSVVDSGYIIGHSSGAVPPHLQGPQVFSTAAVASSAVPSVIHSSSALSNGNDYVPPHLRGRAGPASTTANLSAAPLGGLASTSSISNPYEDRESTASMTQTARWPPIPFVGYDQSGQPHQQYRMASGTTTPTPPPAAATPPASRVAPGAQPSRPNGNWARAVGIRNGGNRYVHSTTRAPATHRNRGYDSDGSIDEM